jgi:hypothetical protein
MKIVYTIVFLVVVVGIVLIYLNKTKEMQTHTLTFKHSTESYSFEYPSNLKVEESTGKRKVVTLRLDNEEKDNVINMEVKYGPNYMKDLEKKVKSFSTAGSEAPLKVKNIDIKKYKVVNAEFSDLGYVYIVPLESSDSPSEYIFISTSKAANEKLVTELIETLKVDIDRMRAYTDSLKSEYTEREAVESVGGDALPGEF